MKIKMKLVLITILLIFSQVLFAQEQQSTGAVPYMKVEKIHRIVNTSDNPASIAYGHESQSSFTISMPIPAGTPFTQLFNWAPSTFASSMAANPPGFYYITETGPPAILHQTYGDVVLPVGEIIGMGNEKPNGITYNTINQCFYIASSTNLYSFDLLKLSATLIGPFNTGGNIIDLCFNENGVCFAYDVVTDCAYTINILTGEASLLGPLGYDANFGQGMSYDYETQTIYLSAFNNSTFTGQLRTMNPQTGMTTLITDWGLNQIAPFQCDRFDIPCIVQGPYNPNPVFGAPGVPITGTSLSWTNSPQTENVEIWFGPIHNVVKVYDGPVISSYELPTLLHDKQYIWRVICKNENCGTPGLIWSFTTVQQPILAYWCDEFYNLNNWTIVGPLGTTNWTANNSANAGGTAPELRMSWTPSFNGESKLRSIPISLPNNQYVSYQFNIFFDWYADPSGQFKISVTYDGGLTSIPLYTLTDPTGNIGPTIIQDAFVTPPTGSQNSQFEITYTGNSFNIDYIYLDNLCVDYCLSCYPPNAPGNLTAEVIPILNPQVQLGWQDNSWNENGFKIFRKKGYPNDPGEFIAIDTALSNITQYIDTSVTKDSTYSYSVFAFNQWGQNGSDTVTITVSVPVGLEIISDELPDEFALHQNYPNPFNPSTKIKYQIPASSLNPFSKGEGTFVTLKVYDILGNEVATLVNEEQTPGVYEVEFNVAQVSRPEITSGIYFYQLRTGEFNQTKKMILLK
jgi:hypothetical protein